MANNFKQSKSQPQTEKMLFLAQANTSLIQDINQSKAAQREKTKLALIGFPLSQQILQA